MIRTTSASAAIVLALAALPAAVLGAAAFPAKAADAADLTVAFKDIQTPSGAVMFVLFDSESAFDQGGKPVRAVQVPVSGASAEAKVTGLKPGRYGVKAFHDLDGNGRMDANPFGIPTEPFAFSNDAKGNMGPPKWADAAFEVSAAGVVHTIKID